MKTHLMTATAAAFFLGLGSAAVAQDAGTSGATLSASNPSQVTCSELTAMESDRAEGFLYFVAGYHQAERFGTTTTGMTGSTLGTDTGSTAGTDTAASTTLPSDSGTDTSATAGTDTAASTTLPSDSGAAADTTGATATAGASGSDQFSSMGFVDIPVEQIMSACESEPQSRVADLIQREVGQGGTTAQ